EATKWSVSWPSLVPAEAWLWRHPAGLPVDDLRQPGTTGRGRHGATHDQSLRPTSEMRRSRRLRRRETPTRPMSNEVWSVRRLPLRLVHELGREPVLGGGPPPHH